MKHLDVWAKFFDFLADHDSLASYIHCFEESPWQSQPLYRFLYDTAPYFWISAAFRWNKFPQSDWKHLDALWLKTVADEKIKKPVSENL